jgi:hypothetical protein
MADNVVINITEDVNDVVVNAIPNVNAVSVAITENVDLVGINVTPNVNAVSIDVVEEINEVVINVSEYDAQQINVILLDLQLTNRLNRYVEFEYDVDGNVDNKSIYRDDTKIVKYYNIDYAYNSGDLITMTVTRISDSFSYVKEFEYDIDGNLINININ